MDFSLLGFSEFKDVLNIHPAFVHFPIALIPSAFLFFGNNSKETVPVRGGASMPL